MEKTDYVCIAQRIERASVWYLKGQHVIIGIDKEPVFGKIEFFVCMPSSDDWFTVDFCAHYHCYSVNYLCPKVYKIVTFDSLVDFHAVCYYWKATVEKAQYFVRLPYHVVQSNRAHSVAYINVNCIACKYCWNIGSLHELKKNVELDVRKQVWFSCMYSNKMIDMTILMLNIMSCLAIQKSDWYKLLSKSKAPIANIKWKDNNNH